MKPPLDKSPGDYAHLVGKIAAGLVPYVGGALAETFECLFAAPLEKRREQWLRKMGTAIEELYATVDGLTPEKLRENEDFISACLQASSIALRSHQGEKIAALRAALKNTVLMEGVGATKSSMFIRLVDEFSVLHLRILDMYDRAGWYARQLHAKTPRVFKEYPHIATIWDEVYTTPRSDDPLVMLAERDIATRGLAYTETMRTRPSGDSKLSPLGKEFLAFIRDESADERGQPTDSASA